jgi:hypothetical protein
MGGPRWMFRGTGNLYAELDNLALDVLEMSRRRLRHTSNDRWRSTRVAARHRTIGGPRTYTITRVSLGLRVLSRRLWISCLIVPIRD